MTKSKALSLDLKKALGRLEEVVKLKKTIVNQDATIKRFEFTFELSWKLMQSILKDNAIDTYGVKNVFREAARLGLIDDPQVWFKFLEARNLTAHTYEEEIAKKVYQKAKKFVKYVQDLIVKIKNYV